MIKINKEIGEQYTKICVHGLDIYVIPKKLSTAYAVLGVDFGSSDTEFLCDGKPLAVPAGIAHFLEHKMFENEDGTDAFEQFSILGANANAFTAASKTCYMFSCTENFEESLALLLKVVTRPHFTENSVEKERLIINKEIRMYMDDPYWKMYFGLLDAMYHNSTIRTDPAGTEESIADITPDMLYDCHRMFYKGDNMALCVCGDVDAETVERVAAATLEELPVGIAERIQQEEPQEVRIERVEACLDIAVPLFAIGIKCPEIEMGKERILAGAEHEIILQMVFGKSGRFYNDCYETGLLGDRFSAGFSSERGTSFVMISGSSPNPDEVYRLAIQEIELCRKEFCTEAEFDRAKKVCYSTALDVYNSTEEIANAFLGFVFDGCDLLDYTSMLRNADYERVKNRFMRDYRTDRTAFSVVYPKED